MSTTIWAHRGAHRIYPENSLEAYEEAIRLGAEGIEIDVQRSSDGALVVIHDEYLMRLTGHRAYVKDLTFRELREIALLSADQDRTYSIPLLKEVLDLLTPTDLMLNIELKNSYIPYPGMEDQILNMVEYSPISARVCYSSFNHSSMAYLAEQGLGYKSGLLYERAVYEDCYYALNRGLMALHPQYNLLRRPGFVAKAHDLGLKVHPWTVTSPEAIHLALTEEVNALITDDVALALEIREKVNSPTEKDL